MRACLLVLLLAVADPAISETLAVAPASAKAQLPLNGFDVAKHGVPVDKILPGGPARDGMARVDEPRWAAPEEASWVRGDTPVIGFEAGGESRAIPVHLIEYHQIVNDEVGGVPVVITFDPICATPIVYRAQRAGKPMRFGISGLIYNSNFLLYDLETESLWSQVLGEAIAGPLTGQKLERLRVHQEPFGVWLGRSPQTRVLARPMPREIDYRHSPYSRYWISETVPFPVAAKDDKFHPKEVVLGVEVGGVTRAYLGSVLTAAGGRIVDEVAGHKIRVHYESEVGNFIWDAPPALLATDSYWFSWKAFHPDTQIWSDAKR
jgi:hypothetical protein